MRNRFLNITALIGLCFSVAGHKTRAADTQGTWLQRLTLRWGWSSLLPAPADHQAYKSWLLPVITFGGFLGLGALYYYWRQENRPSFQIVEAQPQEIEVYYPNCKLVINPTEKREIIAIITRALTQSDHYKDVRPIFIKKVKQVPTQNLEFFNGETQILTTYRVWYNQPHSIPTSSGPNPSLMVCTNQHGQSEIVLFSAHLL